MQLLHKGKITQVGLAELLPTFRDVADEMPDNIIRYRIHDSNHEGKGCESVARKDRSAPSRVEMRASRGALWRRAALHF